MRITTTLARLTDDALLRRLSQLVLDSRRVEADLIAHIAEVDARRLYAREASSSMHVYCTDVLHLSEAEAYFRITAARAARKYPVLLEMLADGRLHLTGIARLAPHLTAGNIDELLKRAVHRSTRAIEALVAELAPRPDVATSIRKLPARAVGPAPGSADRNTEATGSKSPRGGAGQLVAQRVVGATQPALSSPPARVQPLSPERYKVQFTVSAELREKLTRLQALMRSSVPDGDLAAIIEQAVSEKLERLEAKRFGKARSPRKSLAETDTSATSRYLPAAVRRIVHERDGGRCTFVEERGRRCRARERLEYHHEDPYARSGNHNPANIHLLCRTHNVLLAERDYGKQWMDQFRSRRKLVRPTVARTAP